MKKFRFLPMAALAVVSIALTSCKDDEDGWTYFKNEEIVEFEDAVGKIFYDEEEHFYWFRVANDIQATIPRGGDEDGVVYVIKDSPENLAMYEGKRCIVGGNYQLKKINNWGMGTTTYYEMNIRTIAEYYGDGYIREQKDLGCQHCATIAPEFPDTKFFESVFQKC